MNPQALEFISVREEVLVDTQPTIGTGIKLSHPRADAVLKQIRERVSITIANSGVRVGRSLRSKPAWYGGTHWFDLTYRVKLIIPRPIQRIREIHSTPIAAYFHHLRSSRERHVWFGGVGFTVYDSADSYRAGVSLTGTPSAMKS